jgi:sulfur carrier protein
MIAIKLNGQTIKMTESVSLETFLNQNNLANQGGVAVALNQTVIQKKDWSAKQLENNDDIIIITATQGG